MGPPDPGDNVRPSRESWEGDWGYLPMGSTAHTPEPPESVYDELARILIEEAERSDAASPEAVEAG